MKFKADENLPVDVVEILKMSGHDASTVYSQKMVGCKDSEIYEVCKNEKRIILTLDIDFSNIRNYPPGDHSGIIVFRLKSQDKLYLLKVFNKVLNQISQEEVNGKLWIVEDTKIRIRSFE